MNRNRIIRNSYNPAYQGLINNKNVLIQNTNDLIIQEKTNYNDYRIKIKQYKISSNTFNLEQNDLYTFLNNLFNTEENNLTYTYQIYIPEIRYKHYYLENNNSPLYTAIQSRYFNKSNYSLILKYFRFINYDETNIIHLADILFNTIYIYVYVNNITNLLFNRSGLNNINIDEEDNNNLLNQSGLDSIFNNFSFETAKGILRDKFKKKLNKINNQINIKQKEKNKYTRKKDYDYSNSNNNKYKSYKNYNKIVVLNSELNKLTKKYNNIKKQIKKLK